MMQYSERLLALFFLILLSPILLCSGFFIITKYPGSLFFYQIREGKGGKTFYILKLRTMVTDAKSKLNEILNSDLERAKEWEEFGCLKEDPRIAGFVAKLVRQLSIDEIPQLWNIVKGEMSFIGPRPIELFLAESLNKDDRQFRNTVKPGLTGLWQVGPRSNTSIRGMMRYDKLYLRNKGFKLKFFIIKKTIMAVLNKTGI